MFFSNILNYIKGYLTIVIEGLFPERLINLCALKNIPLWNLQRRDKTHISANMNIYNFRRIKEINRKAKCTVHIEKKHGIPFVVYRYRKRKLLVLGIVVFFVALYIMTQFVWVIELTGNTKITKEQMLDCVSPAGLYLGVPTKNVDSQELQSHIMTSLEQVAFVTVNTKGSTVYIDIREREPKRTHFDKNIPVNIVASQSGVIESTLVQNGTSLVKKGDVVYKGQLLVSGADDSKLYGIKYTHSDGQILARVWHEKTVSLPSYKTEKIVSDNKITKRKLKIFGLNVNLYVKNKILFEKYDILSYTNYIRLGNNLELPIGIETTEYSEYIEKSVKLSEEQLKKQLVEEMDKEYSESQIISRNFKIQDDKMTVTYECIEDIAEKEEINGVREISGG